MPCAHYKTSGNITCTICIHAEIRDIDEKVKQLLRRRNDLLRKVGEEPKE